MHQRHERVRRPAEHAEHADVRDKGRVIEGVSKDYRTDPFTDRALHEQDSGSPNLEVQWGRVAGGCQFKCQ